MSIPPRDPEHWLYRFTSEEWLRAARAELSQAEAALRSKLERKGVANARRAAGMALNAVLVQRPVEAWGRSYMDHLNAVARDESLPGHVREAADRLLASPLGGPRLVQLGKPDGALVAAATTILSWCVVESSTAAARPADDHSAG